MSTTSGGLGTSSGQLSSCNSLCPEKRRLNSRDFLAERANSRDILQGVERKPVSSAVRIELLRAKQPLVPVENTEVKPLVPVENIEVKCVQPVENTAVSAIPPLIPVENTDESAGPEEHLLASPDSESSSLVSSIVRRFEDMRQETTEQLPERSAGEKWRSLNRSKPVTPNFEKKPPGTPGSDRSRSGTPNPEENRIDSEGKSVDKNENEYKFTTVLERQRMFSDV